MFEVSNSALKVLAEYLSEQNIKSAIRITPMAGNCAGLHLRLRVGEAKASDNLFRHGGLLFLVDQKLLAECGSIRIDYVESCTSCCCSGGCGGFRISGERKYPFVGRCVTESHRCEAALRHRSPPPRRIHPDKQPA